MQAALSPADSWITSYRCHCTALLRGSTVEQVFAELFGFSQADVQRVRALVRAIGCPILGPRLGGVDHWMQLMRGDKKTEAGEINFILMPKIGETIRRAAPADLVAKVILRNTA
jgi:3-dehydroquinate synthase